MRPAALAVLLTVAFAGIATSAAADITLRARLDAPQLRVGRAADLSVEASGAQDVPAPQIPTPRGVTIRYVGPSTQLSIVNGRTEASITHHFSVVAQSPGTFTLAPIAVDYQGKRYEAAPITVEALAAGAAAPGGAAGADDEPLHLSLIVPKTDVYLHERVPITLQLSIGNVRVTDVEFPTVGGEGFALDKFGQPSQREDRAGASTVQIAEFTTNLTPLRSGQLTVGPAHLNLAAVTRRRRGGGNDPFFGGFFGGSREAVDLASDPVTLNVMPLPEAGKPADFSGAVGKFDLDVRAAPLELQAGDPITVTTTVRGTGNLEHVTPPVVGESNGVRVYPAQPANAGSTPVPGARVDTKTYEQVVIPERPGPFAIPELRFSWFDPDARTYRTVTHPPIPVTVRASAARNAQGPEIVGGAPAAARPERLGRDIVFIKDAPGRLRPIGSRWYRSPLFWLVQLVPLLLWLGIAAYDRRRQRLRGDTGYARYTRAGREARTALAAARGALKSGDRIAFYDAVAATVRDYLSAKLDLPPGGVTPDAVHARLRGRGNGTEIEGELRELFDVCERVRFAPSADGDRDMAATLARAEGIIRRLERGRVAPPIAATIAVALLGAVSTAIVVDHALTPTVAAADAPGAPATSENPSALFFQANGLYSSEHYADAAATYEKILAAGRESGNVYFNLGNAYFRSGDLGRAILSYERARRLIPGDPDLRANLTFARTEAGTAEDEPLYARLLFPLAGRLSTDALLLAASAAYTLIVLALIAARLAPAATRASRVVAAIAAVGGVVVLSAGVYRLVTLDLPSYAVVIAPDETTVRFEPAAGGTAHFTAKRGAVLRVLVERPDWLQVARSDGQRGWVERTALAPI